MKDFGGILETAERAGNFKIFLKLVKAAGLERLFRDSRSLVVFAPTDEAFARMPPETLKRLMQPENAEELVSLLKYHMVTGPQMNLGATVTTTEVKTVHGAALKVKADRTGVMVNESRVTRADLACSNGVIHAIDDVTLPPAK